MDESSLTAADVTDAVELTTCTEDSATLPEDDDAEEDEDEDEVVLTDDESSTSPAGTILFVLALATLGMMLLCNALYGYFVRALRLTQRFVSITLVDMVRGEALSMHVLAAGVNRQTWRKTRDDERRTKMGVV